MQNVGANRVSYRKLENRECTVLVLHWYLLRLKNYFKPGPLNRILVLLRVLFKNFRRGPPVLFIWESPSGKKSLARKQLIQCSDGRAGVGPQYW